MQPSDESTAPITRLLSEWRSGDRASANRLVSAIYPVLHDLARAQLNRQGAQLTLRATELAHEAYARLMPQAGVDWRNRAHFYAIAATVMRRVLVDHLRERSTEKRGGTGTLFVPIQDIDVGELPAIGDQVDWVAVDQALNDLEAVDPDCARVVELRLFSGLEVAEIAEALDSSTATVGRQWRFARAWLADRLGVVKPASDPGDGR